MTEQEVEQFCNHLKLLMLDYLQQGQPVCIQIKNDTEPVYGDRYLSEIVEHTLLGYTYPICFGRPAARLVKEERARRAAFGLLTADAPLIATSPTHPTASLPPL